MTRRASSELVRRAASSVRVNVRVRQEARAAAGFDAAKVDRLTADWSSSPFNINDVLRTQLVRLRTRARDLELNNDHQKKFLGMVVNNVVGSAGVSLQMKVPGDSKKQPTQDKPANELIEQKWKEWGRNRVPTTDGQLSWVGLQRVAARTWARDGEFLARKVKGWNGNKFKFALQVLPSESLDETLWKDLPNGNKLRLGVECDTWGRPVNYYFRKAGFSDVYEYGQGVKHEVVPADEVVHLFFPLWLNQKRGIPWSHTAMGRLNMLGGYEDAELTAARIAASKMGFYESEDAETAETIADTPPEEGQDPLTEVAPGVFEKLPVGTKFHAFDPQHPSQDLAAFEKAILRNAASGLEVSYNSLANDLEGVNFSSLRTGAQEERETWKTLQGWFIERLVDTVFQEWLTMSLLTKQVALPFTKYDKFAQGATWHARRWSWVDPQKEVTAKVTELANGLTTRTAILAEQGKEFEDVVEELRAEEAALKAAGLVMPIPTTETKSQGTGQPAEEQEPTPDEDEPAGKPPAGTEEEPSGTNA